MPDEDEVVISTSKKNQPTTDTKQGELIVKSGILYMQTVPPFYTVRKVTEVMSQFGPIGRVFLQTEKRRCRTGKIRRRYSEGWVEFNDRKLAKRVSISLNNTPVGGSRRSKASDSLWTLKYLSGFKWQHLTEQLAYEQKVEQQRMRVEISQAKREAGHFAAQVDKGAELTRLERKVLKKGGLWERYQRQVRQKTTIKDHKNPVENAELLQMIFNKQ